MNLCFRGLLGRTRARCRFPSASRAGRRFLCRLHEVRNHRYCQALMKAGHGDAQRYARPEGLACPAAAAAFGWRPLPAQLANGKGLVAIRLPLSRGGAAHVRRHAPTYRGGGIARSRSALAAGAADSRRIVVEGPAKRSDVAPARRPERSRRRAADTETRPSFRRLAWTRPSYLTSSRP